jgi:hypothetical protein
MAALLTRLATTVPGMIGTRGIVMEDGMMMTSPLRIIVARAEVEPGVMRQHPCLLLLRPPTNLFLKLQGLP